MDINILTRHKEARPFPSEHTEGPSSELSKRLRYRKRAGGGVGGDKGWRCIICSSSKSWKLIYPDCFWSLTLWYNKQLRSEVMWIVMNRASWRTVGLGFNRMPSRDRRQSSRLLAKQTQRCTLHWRFHATCMLIWAWGHFGLHHCRFGL